MEEKKQNVLLLIDASALIHRFFHALPVLTTPDNKPIQAIYGLTATMLISIFAPRGNSFTQTVSLAG